MLHTQINEQMNVDDTYWAQSFLFMSFILETTLGTHILRTYLSVFLTHYFV